MFQAMHVVRQMAAFLSFWVASGSGWALCPNCPPVYIPVVPWHVLATVTQLSDGLYDYNYTASPSEGDYTHLLKSIALPIPDAAAVQDVRVATGIWANSAFHIVPAGTQGFTSTSIEFTGDETDQALFNYSGYGLPPAVGLVFGFKSSYAPVVAPYRLSLEGTTFFLNGTYIGNSHTQTGNTLVPGLVPEPESLTLLLAGSLTLLAMLKRR